MRSALIPIAGLLALGLAAAPVRADDFAWPALTPEEAREEVALVRRAMDHAYPGFGRFAAQPALEARLDAVAEDPPDDARGMYAELAGALAVLQDSHLVLEPGAGWARHAASAPLYAGWRCSIEDDALFAVSVSGPAREAGLAPGDEVLSVDGVLAADYIAAAAAAAPQDGPSDRARRAQLCAPGASFPGSGFDHYAPFLFDTGAAQTLEVRGADGAMRTVSAPRLTLAGLAEAFGADWIETRARARDDVLYVTLPERAAYLKIAAFEAGPDGPAALTRVFEDLFLSGADTLILDLRGNTGGSTLMALTLLRYLAAEPVRMMTLALAAAPDLSELDGDVRASDPRLMRRGADLFTPFAGGGWRAEGPEFAGMLGAHDPLQPAFRGDLYVLTDALTGSAAAMAAAQLKTSGRGVLLGEPTGGAAQGPVGGLYAFVHLPHSDHMLRIPLLRQYSQPAEGPEAGVAPDIAVRPDLADLLAGRDPALARALNLAREPDAAPARPNGPALAAWRGRAAAAQPPAPPEVDPPQPPRADSVRLAGLVGFTAAAGRISAR